MKTILLVDDSETCRMLFKLVLSDTEAYTLHEAADMEAALDKLTHIVPDAVVVDYTLPGSNGLQLAERIREQGVTASLTLLTASVEDDVYRQALVSHFDLVFEKPITEDKIAQILQTIAVDQRA